MSKKDLIPAVAYARVSTLSSDQKNSFENQQQIFIEEAEKLGYYLVKECGNNGIYADRGISGKSVLKRDEFNRMIKDSHKGFFKQVLTTNIARYARDIVTLQDTVRQLRKSDIGVYFLKENLNTGDYAKTYGDEVMLNILGSLAQNELVQLSKGIQIGIRQAQRDGKWTSQPPYGYDRINGFLQINEYEANIIKWVFDMYVNNGYSFMGISEELNKKNIPSKKNKKWQQSTIKKMITNPIYTGLQVNYQTMMLDIFTNKIEVIDDEERIKHQFEHLRLIDDDLYKKAQEIRICRLGLTSNKQKYSSIHLLSNIFFCGSCNGSMKRMQRSDKKGIYYFLCNNRHRDKITCQDYNYITEQNVLDYIIKEIEEFKNYNLKLLKGYYDKYIQDNLNFELVKELPSIQLQIEKLERRKLGFQNMKADGDMTKEEYSFAVKELNLGLQGLKDNRTKIENLNYEIEHIYKIYNDFVNSINSFNKDDLDNLKMRKIIKKITIKNKQISIVWNTGIDKDFEEIMKSYLAKNNG